MINEARIAGHKHRLRVAEARRYWAETAFRIFPRQDQSAERFELMHRALRRKSGTPTKDRPLNQIIKSVD